MSSSNAITRIRRLLLSKKVGAFLICLSIASLLWVVHALNRNYKYTLHIPVSFLNLPSNKLLVGDLPEKLDVDIKASGLKLLFISFNKQIDTTYIDFNLLKNNAKSLAYSIKNTDFSIQHCINFDVEVLKIRPDTLFFSSNKSKSKLVPIKANLKVNCLAGYSVVSKPIITPAFVTIWGDSIDLKNTDTVYTHILNLKNIHKNFEGSVIIKKSKSSINYSVKDVKVNFNVDKLIESNIKIPIQIINNPDKETIKLIPSNINIKYLVAMNEYENITVNSFKAIVNYQSIKEKQKKLFVEIIKAPSEIKIIKKDPMFISYLIFK